jgi:Protein of unknown function (DUF3108)
MARHPLLRGKLEKPAAAFLFSTLLPFGFAAAAFAEGEESKPAKPISENSAPVDSSKANETLKQPAGEPTQTGPEAKKEEPSDTKPAAGKPDNEKAKTADSKPAEMPKDAKASEAGAAPGTPGKGTSPANQPSAGQTAEDSAAAIVPPNDANIGTKPSEAKGTEASAGAPSKETRPETKGNAPSLKPGDSKESTAGARPRDLAPKPDSSESVTVQASSVNALYHINWLGTHIGDFKIRSSITNRQYSLQANADISVFFGAVSWQGVTSSHGLMTANGPVPQAYSFRYSTNDRHEAIELRFQQRMVQDILINPPQHPGSRNVPITAADLQNVVDPLSAIILLSQARLSRNNGDACSKRLPIFDGKIRYDLVLSLKGTRSISPTGRLHGTAYVCRVSYVPIAGHKPSKQGGDYAAGNTGIEVWLVPLPEAGLLVPYYIHVPTPAGTASMVTARFDVETSGGRHALAD